MISSKKYVQKFEEYIGQDMILAAAKSAEYTVDNDNKFSTFECYASLHKTTVPDAILKLVSKQFISLVEAFDKTLPSDWSLTYKQIKEKCQDIRIYMILLQCYMEDRMCTEENKRVEEVFSNRAPVKEQPKTAVGTIGPTVPHDYGLIAKNTAIEPSVEKPTDCSEEGKEYLERVKAAQEALNHINFRGTVTRPFPEVDLRKKP